MRKRHERHLRSPLTCILIFDNFETYFPKILFSLRLEILKDSEILRLIRYEYAIKFPYFFMLK